MRINIETFEKQFDREYDLLYKSENEVAGYEEAVNAFDEFVKTHGDFVGEFAKYRGDYVSSDREAAAFMFALEKLGGN